MRNTNLTRKNFSESFSTLRKNSATASVYQQAVLIPKFVIVLELGGIIKKDRLAKGLSQEYVADELGLSTGAYSKIERGATKITVNRLNDICLLFKVNYFDLLAGQSEYTSFTKSAKTNPNYSRENDLLKLEIDSLKKALVDKESRIKDKEEIIELLKRSQS